MRPRLGVDEVRRRAGGGVALLSARTALVALFGVGANILLARLLVPRDFGLVALGGVLLVFGGQLANAGVGAALIRGSAEPGLRQLQAVSGAQLAVVTALAVVVGLVAVPVGRDGAVVAVMVASLPIAVLRTPSVLLLERRLSYREIATADVVEAVAFYAWSVTAVVLGAGVWGIATGMYARAVSGTAVIARLGPVGLVRPRWSWRTVRPLMAFGVKFQALSTVQVVREQGLNAASAAVAGVAALGVWNLAWRILQVPFMLFGAVTRVAYPAISALLEAGEDPRPVLERGAATLAVASGLFLTAIAGFAPALPELVGPGWEDLPETLLWSSAALAVGTPVAVMAMGYLTAADALGVALRGAVAAAAAWFAVTIPLVGHLGPPAVGIGWIASGVLGATVLAHGVAARSGARLLRYVSAPALLTLAGAGAGWLLSRELGASIGAGLLGVALGELVLVGGLALVRRGLLRETRRLLVDALRSSFGGGSETRPATTV